MTTATYYYTIDDIKAANKAIGHHFFEPGTMRFFRSRVGRNVYGGHYFVTSEQFDERSPRLYTVRSCYDGKVETVSEFQAYRTLAAATATAKAQISK